MPNECPEKQGTCNFTGKPCVMETGDVCEFYQTLLKETEGKKE